MGSYSLAYIMEIDRVQGSGQPSHGSHRLPFLHKNSGYEPHQESEVSPPLTLHGSGMRLSPPDQ